MSVNFSLICGQCFLPFRAFVCFTIPDYGLIWTNIPLEPPRITQYLLVQSIFIGIQMTAFMWIVVTGVCHDSHSHSVTCFKYQRIWTFKSSVKKDFCTLASETSVIVTNIKQEKSAAFWHMTPCSPIKIFCTISIVVTASYAKLCKRLKRYEVYFTDRSGTRRSLCPAVHHVHSKMGISYRH